jgi:hypothetical protein
MARIFLSYRRDDSRADAGRLFDRLGQYFGRDNLFMDVDTIALGVDFVPAISGDLLSAVISTRYILGFRKDNPNVFNRLVQNLPHC